MQSMLLLLPISLKPTPNPPLRSCFTSSLDLPHLYLLIQISVIFLLNLHFLIVIRIAHYSCLQSGHSWCFALLLIACWFEALPLPCSLNEWDALRSCLDPGAENWRSGRLVFRFWGLYPRNRFGLYALGPGVLCRRICCRFGNRGLEKIRRLRLLHLIYLWRGDWTNVDLSLGGLVFASWNPFAGSMVMLLRLLFNSFDFKLNFFYSLRVIQVE